ncbi:MAG: phosphatidate cytidylyltransferase [Ardenticatenaceae bacterium]|nr:phosphatidate cytidylyltransferase [Anaerolineales bacterium]MCB8920271.1 phosphatidate cytidylyltransferase [Ardenticatenaceae bacterium]
MFIQRALVTFTLGPLALYLVYLGGWFYFVPITAVLLLAAVEYSDLIHELGLRNEKWVLVTAVFLLLLTAQWFPPTYLAPISVICFIASLAIVLWSYEKKTSNTVPADWMGMTTGIVLIGWIGSHFMLLRNLDNMAWQWTMLALLSTWLADSAAYVVGRFLAGKIILGHHQLSPRLSPNKTIEGYAGGILLGTLITVTIAKILQLPLVAALILGLLVSIISPVGDLGISLLKREAGVKDSGRIFGEHGGALDRVDSLLWSVTMAYYLILILQIQS